MYPSLASTCYVAKDELELLCLLPKCWEYHVYTIYPARVLFNGKLKLECKMIFLGCVGGESKPGILHNLGDSLLLSLITCP